jgi:glycosyltransferase involved in cell wall biosynthesis
MAPRRTLLFVVDTFPFPLDRGQRVRVLNLLGACAKVFDVTFLGPGPEKDTDKEPVERLCARTVYLPPRPRELRERVALTGRAILSAPGVPRPSNLRRYGPFIAALHEARPEKFDLIWAERPDMGRLFRKELRGRTVLDLDDLEHRKQERLLRIEREPVARARSMYRYAVYRYLELSWARNFLASVVCSEEDRQYLVAHGCLNGVVVPNGPASLRPTSRPARTRDPRSPLRLVFLGNVGAEPNADAIQFFANDVLPAVRAQSPDVTFDVIGPNPHLAQKSAPAVRFRGFVENLEAALAEYDVLVAPLRFGGGTKLKVLDAMANRIPVVTTPVGAEGLSVVHREHAWIAERSEIIVEGILRIKRDPALADRLAENAFAHVQERFSNEAIRDRLSEWLVKLAPRHS